MQKKLQTEVASHDAGIAIVRRAMASGLLPYHGVAMEPEDAPRIVGPLVDILRLAKPPNRVITGCPHIRGAPA